MSNIKGQKNTAILVLVGLIVCIIVAVLVQVWFPDFKVIPFIGVVSTLSIALLTVAYVIVTSSQLNVMHSQLTEMSRSRELSAQPLPLLILDKVNLSRPRFFYTPPDDSYLAKPRLFVYFKLTNQGIHPAVNIITAARLIINTNGSDITFGSSENEIDVIGAASEFPPENENFLSFMFNDDELDKLVNILRDRSFRDQPLIAIRLIYKNILGACFAGTWFFEFFTKSEDDFHILGNWETKLVSFDAEYKEELKQLRTLQDKDEDAWFTLFESVKERLTNSLTGSEELELAWSQIPNSFHTEVISNNDYESEAKQSSFGRQIPEWMPSCMYKD